MYYREWTDRLNLYYLLENIATKPSTADRVLLIFEGKRLSYKDVYEQVLKYGQWLKKEAGVKKGDIVALDFQNSDTYIFLWLGLWSIGAKPAFINYNLSGASLAHCIKAATTKLCIVDPNVEENVSQSVKDELKDVRFLVASSCFGIALGQIGVPVYFHESNGLTQNQTVDPAVAANSTSGKIILAEVERRKCSLCSSVELANSFNAESILEFIPDVGP